MIYTRRYVASIIDQIVDTLHVKCHEMRSETKAHSAVGATAILSTDSAEAQRICVGFAFSA